MWTRRQRRRVLVVALATAAIVGLGGIGVWFARDTPYIQPQHQAVRAASTAAEMAYVHRYWLHRNSARFGNFGGTDCVNFTSQALLARGWPMTADWGHSTIFGLHGYTRSWVSSTALMRYLAPRPQLAVAVDDAHRAALSVGDIAQFDWDDSGDRDHTGIVSRIQRMPDGHIAVFIAEHSPSALYQSVDALLAQHARTHVVVHYWHLAT